MKLDGEGITIFTPDKPDIVLKRVEAAAPTVEDLAAYAGEYRSEEVVSPHRIRVRDGQLVTRAGFNQHESALRPRDRDVFETEGVVLRFLRDAQGAVIGYTVSAASVASPWARSPRIR
jgi:hypothetical protein